MPNIPTYEGGQSTQTGGYSGIGSDSFGLEIARAGQNLGNSIMTTAQVIDEKQKHIKSMDDQKWANEQYEKAKLSLAEYSANPEVAQAEDVASKIQDYSKSINEQVTPDSAPSHEAYQMFRQNFNNWSNSRVVAAFDQGYENKINNSIGSVNTQISSAITSYRQSSAKDKLPGLIDSVASIKSYISNSFDKYAPKVADKLRTDLITQTVLATAGDNPAAARSFLNSETSIDEQTRRSLQNEINQAAHVKNQFEIYQFDSATKDVVTAARAGTVATNPFTLDYYKAFYGDDMGQARKAEDDKQIATYSQGNDILKAISGQAAPYQQKVLNTLGDRTKWTVADATDRENLFAFVSQKIQANIELQDKDTAAFLQLNNPHVKQANDAVSIAHEKYAADPKNEELRASYSAKLKQANDISLLFQGAPPEGTDAQDAPLYLNRSSNQMTLLPNKIAEDYGTELNQAKPQEFIKKTGDILAQYGDDKQRMIVFNDLVTKGKLSQQYQFAWLNKDAWWVDSYLGAVKAGNDVKLAEKDMKDLEGYVDSNPSFKNLQATMIGDNLQRSSEIRGFKEGITQWAKVLVTQGKSPKDAATLAAKNLIESKLGFTKVNGKPLMFLRERPGLPDRDKATDEVLGPALESALQQIPIKEVDTTPFTALQTLGTDDAKNQALSNQINSRAYWQTGSNGQSASLYAIDENGIQAFQVHDKQGKPFIVNFDEVPRVSLIGRRNLFPTYNTSTTRPSWIKSE